METEPSTPEAVPFDRPDPAGVAGVAPFAGAQSCLSALFAWIDLEVAAELAALHLGLEPSTEPRPLPAAGFAARAEATRLRGEAPALLRAFDAWALSTGAQRTIGAVLAAELDGELADKLRGLDERSDGLTLRILARLSGRALLDVAAELAPDGLLGGLELVTVGDEDRPLGARRVRATARLVALAAGVLAPDPALGEASLESSPRALPTRAPFSPISPFSDEVLALLATLAERARPSDPIALVASPPGFGACDALIDELTGADRVVLRVATGAASLDERHARRVLREARLLSAMIVVDLPQAPFPPWLGAWLDALAGDATPLYAVAEGLEAPTPQARVPIARVEVEVPNDLVRAALWREALDGALPDVELTALASTFAIGPATLRAAATLARRRAGEAPLRLADLHAALEAHSAGRLGPLATPVVPFGGGEQLDDLVVSDEVGERLLEFAERLRRRGDVIERGGLRRRVPRDEGVRALFTGPNGTGKVMAATVVARALGLPPHFVDCAALAVKGGAAAERAVASLLRAAEVWPSLLVVEHAETLRAPGLYGALVARLERFRGVVVVVSEQDQPEQALRDRFSLCVHFPAPTEAQREALFRAWLPAGAGGPGLDPAELARRHALTGGRIRELVLRATTLAAAAGEPLTGALLQAAADRGKS
jgi:hypothetical protein